MNSDRLTIMPATIVVAGLTTKWTNAYSFLGFTWGTTLTDNGVTFDSLNKNQFALDLAYYLEPEDLFFLLFQAKDSLISVTNGTTALVMNESNIKQILIHKWKKGITQLTTVLSNITVDGEYLIFDYSMTVTNTIDNKESSCFMTKTILSNYLEIYFSYEDINILYPQISLKYKLNWDVIKARFSYRMDMSLGHNLFIRKEQLSLNINDKHAIMSYIDGNLSYDMTYQSSDSTIATVGSGGLITTLKEGACTITITDTLYGLTKVLTVNVISHQLKLSSSLIYLYSGQSRKLSAYVDDNKTSNVIYSTSNPNIISVDSSGNLIQGAENGSCIITVTDESYGLIKTCKIYKQASLFKANTIGGFSLITGSTFQLISYYNNVKTKNVTYSSSDESLATVSSSGLITCTTSSLAKLNCIITITNNIDNSSIQIPIETCGFPINKTNLVAYWSAVGKTNNSPNYNVWEDTSGNGYNLVPYTDTSASASGLFSNKNSAGWQNNWFVFDSVSTANKGHWRITPSPFLLTPNKNLVFAMRFKANFISGYPNMFCVRSGSSTPSFSFYQSNQQNKLQFETTTYDEATKFTYVNAPMTNITVVIQTVSETVADVYINGTKTTTVKISKNTANNTFASVGAEMQNQMGNFFNGAIKAIALYDVTSQLKTDAEMIKLSQDLMALS